MQPGQCMAQRYPDPPEGLTASSQRSRFHVTATAASAQLIDIHDVALSIGDRTLLSDAHLHLEAGTHYGLIGRNGTGKSMLLRALAHRWLPGVPRDIGIFYVDQMEDQTANLDATVRECVLSADAAQTRIAQEVSALEGALEAPGKGVPSFTCPKRAGMLVYFPFGSKSP